MDISIIILNYKSKGLTLNCIKAIKESDMEGLRYEIIVVDNNSEDNIGDILAWQYPNIKFIQNKKNLGHGAGNNVGIKIAQGKYICVANSDTIVFENTFKILYNYMEVNSDDGVVGPQQLSPDKKTIQNSCYRWHKLLTPLYRRTPLGKIKSGQKDLSRLLMSDFDHKSIKEVDWILGSFQFFRAKALKEAKAFDERFFLYFEDTDICRRLWQSNWKVIYNPKAKIIHNHARQSAQIPWYKFFSDHVARLHIVSWLKYIKKWRFK